MKVIGVDSSAGLVALTDALLNATIISFDTETTSTDEMTASLVGISLAMKEGEGYYIPVGHNAGTQLPLEQIISALRRPLTDSRIPKIGHHLKYDFIMLARYGIRVAPLGFDTMVAEWVLDPGSRNLGLKNMASVRLGESMTHIEVQERTSARWRRWRSRRRLRMPLRMPRPPCA
jgi:DNA polymerase-1